MMDKLISESPAELRLLLASAISDLDKTKNLLKLPIKWEKFLRLAEHHRVYPSVYYTFNQLDNPNLHPHVIDAMRLACEENTLSALRITGEMIRVEGLLEKNDINVVVLKGSPLSWCLYGDISTRSYYDVDMLVLYDKLEQSIAILENEGYIRINEYDSYNLTPRQLQIYLRRPKHSSHYSYWNSKKKVLIELHWKLSKSGNVLLLQSEGSTQEMVVAGSPVTVLSDEEWLLYLVLHGAGHRWKRFQWLLDIYRFIQRANIDWGSLEHKAEKTCVKSFLHQALILVSKLFGVDLPTGLDKNIASDRNAWRLAKLALKANIQNAGDLVGRLGAYPFFVKFSYDLYINRGLQNKLNLISKSFGPTVKDIKMVALPDSLYPLYYIIRLFSFFPGLYYKEK